MRANPSVTACRPGVTVPDTSSHSLRPFHIAPDPARCPPSFVTSRLPTAPPDPQTRGRPVAFPPLSFHIQPEGRAGGLCVKDRFTTDRFSPLAALPCPSSHGLPFVDSRDVLTPLPAAPHPHHPDRLLSHLPGQLCFNRGPSNFLA